MRAYLAVVVLSSIVAACTPYIPVKDSFGASALTPSGDIPAETTEFNNYNPGVNRLIAQQICATPYQPLEEKSLAAAAGHLDEETGRCQTHVPLFGD